MRGHSKKLIRGYCKCGCGEILISDRRHKKYFGAACRVRASRARNADTSTLNLKRCKCGRDNCWIGPNNDGGRMTQRDYKDDSCKQFSYRKRKSQD